MMTNVRSIPFTQYLRPNGRTTSVSIQRPDDVTTKAFALIGAGYRFEIEELVTGHVSMTVEYPDHHELSGEAPLVHHLCMNGPDVPETVDTLITEAYELIQSR